MKIRRFIPHSRFVAHWMTGLTAGIFVATGMAALAFGYQPPHYFQVGGTLIAYTGLLAVVAVLLLDRRKDRRAKG